MRSFAILRAGADAAALTAAIAAAPHDFVLVLAPGEEPDAALRAALEAWRTGVGGSLAYDVRCTVSAGRRSVPARDWWPPGPTRFFDRTATGWCVGAGGNIEFRGRRDRMEGAVHRRARLRLGEEVAAIDRATRAGAPSGAGTLARILFRPPFAIARGLVPGRGGFQFAMLDGLHALVREVRAWEARRAVKFRRPTTPDAASRSR
jgi:hypothetical protein